MTNKDLNHMSVQEFRDSGLLFEINRTVLHPLGLALSVESDSDGKITGFGAIWDNRDDGEGIYYDANTFWDGKRRFLAYMSERGGDAHVMRQPFLGYIEQREVPYKVGSTYIYWNSPRLRDFPARVEVVKVQLDHSPDGYTVKDLEGDDEKFISAESMHGLYRLELPDERHGSEVTS